MADDRAGLGPRQQARATTRAALRRPIVIGLALGMVAFIVLDALGLQAWGHLVHHHQNPFFTGLVVGAGLVGTAWAIWSSVTLTDGSWSWRIGALAETWTAQELRKLGDGWEIVNSVPFHGRYGSVKWSGDIDHVAIGPNGVFSVQTKWTADSWSLSQPESDDRLVAAAKVHAKNTASRLDPMARNTVSGLHAIPLLVCWGPGIEPPDQGIAHVGEVHVVAGDPSDLWRDLLTAEPNTSERLTPDQVSQLVQVVRARITEEERLIGKSNEERARTQRMARRSTALAVVALAWSALTTLVVVLSVKVDPVGRVVTDLFRWTGSAAAGFWLLSVLPLCLIAAVPAWRLRRRLRGFSQPTRVATRNLALTLIGLALWVGLVIAAIVAAA